MKRIAVPATLCQKSILISVISDINQVVHPNNSYQIYIFYDIFFNLGVKIREGGKDLCFESKIQRPAIQNMDVFIKRKTVKLTNKKSGKLLILIAYL